MGEEPCDDTGPLGEATHPHERSAPPGVALMITKAQRAALRLLNYSDAAIFEMTPARAHEILREAQR